VGFDCFFYFKKESGCDYFSCYQGCDEGRGKLERGDFVLSSVGSMALKYSIQAQYAKKAYKDLVAQLFKHSIPGEFDFTLVDLIFALFNDTFIKDCS
jgi:hypothetical protein